MSIEIRQLRLLYRALRGGEAHKSPHMQHTIAPAAQPGHRPRRVNRLLSTSNLVGCKMSTASSSWHGLLAENGNMAPIEMRLCEHWDTW
jgi:hypothetical protein